MNKQVTILGALVMTLIALVAGPAVTAAAETVKVYEGSIAGAAYRAEVPARWNGTLLLWSHGHYPPGFLPEEIELTNRPATKQWLLDHGYAVAASNYRTPNGWAVKEALGDQIALLDWFGDNVGQPRRTISAGTSMGGLIAVLLPERNPRRFDGVASLCGANAGGLGFWNTALDVSFAIKTLLAPGSDLPLVNITDPVGTEARVREIVAAALRTPRGQARLALANAFLAIPGWSRAFESRPSDVSSQVNQQADWLENLIIDTGWGAGRAGLEQRAGGNPTWNTGIDYRRQLARSSERDLVRQAYHQAGLSLRADLDRLAAAPRIRPDADAVAYLARYGTPRGTTPAPVVTSHTLGDGGVVPEHASRYADQVHRSGNPGELRQFFVNRAGHCMFTAAEEISTYQALLSRIDAGHWNNTSPDALNAAAARFATPYHELFDWMTGQNGVATPAFASDQPGVFLR